MVRVGKNSFILATMLAGILTGCSGSSSSAPTTAVVADVVVTAKDGLRLDPNSYTATAGEISIAYINDDTIRHTLVVVHDGTRVEGFELDVGKRGFVDQGTVTLLSGNYVLQCTVPGHQNMKADFTVK